MGKKRPLFWFIFVLFSHGMDKYSTNLTINEKSVDGMHESQTQGGRMEGADKPTELWRHPEHPNLLHRDKYHCMLTSCFLWTQ